MKEKVRLDISKSTLKNNRKIATIMKINNTKLEWDRFCSIFGRKFNDIVNYS